MHQGLRILRFELNGLSQIGDGFFNCPSATVKSTAESVADGVFWRHLYGLGQESERFFRLTSHFMNLRSGNVGGGLVRIELKGFVQISYRLFKVALFGVEKSAPAMCRDRLHQIGLRRLD